MAADAAALLDQLMGRSRNALSTDDVCNDHWSDPDICKYFLCGFCPSDLFTNTKSDIGVCEKIHDEELRLSYEASDEKGTKGYEEAFLEYLEKLIRDLDRRIQRGKERLERSANANQEAFNEKTGFMYTVKLKELGEEIDMLIGQSQELGEAGRVDEAQELIKRVENLEREKDREKAMQMMLNSNVPQVVAGFELDPGNFHEKNEICDVCGCFLIIGDTQARIDAHLMGKQHLGYARIRHTIAELKKAREEKMAKAMEERRKRREELDKQQRSPRRARRSRSPERHRRTSHRSPGGGGRRRSRSRDRDRDQRRRRSHSRDRHRSSRDYRRSRSRERGRYRSHHSQSRERRRSRSRERRRSKERRNSRRSRSRSRDRRRSRDRARHSRSRSKEKQRSSSHDKKQRRLKSKSRSPARENRSKSKEIMEVNNADVTNENVNGEKQEMNN